MILELVAVRAAGALDGTIEIRLEPVGQGDVLDPSAV